jgi:hypothetical protein
LDGVEVLNDGVVLGKGDVLDVNHNFLERHVVLAAQLEFDLYGLDEHPINTFVLYMKLPLLVVEPIQDVLEVRYFRNIANEIVEERLVVQLVPVLD